jgi:tRNA(fMet)-specific endonuclease VapC
VTHLLDTDICIYWLNGRPEIREQALAVGITKLAISNITVAELYFGAYNSSRVRQNLERAEQFVGAIAIILPTTASLRKFGELKSSLRRSGQPIADFDLLIASTALSEQLILVTNNTRHHERIPDLALKNWIQTG